MAAIKILSVDDEAPIELLMKQYFRRKIRAGEYEFLFARNGLEALAVLGSINTNLVPQQGRWFLATLGVKL